MKTPPEHRLWDALVVGLGIGVVYAILALRLGVDLLG